MDLGLQVNKVSRLVEDYSMNGIRAYDLGQCTHDFYAMAIVYLSLPYNNSSYTVSVRLSPLSLYKETQPTTIGRKLL